MKHARAQQKWPQPRFAGENTASRAPSRDQFNLSLCLEVEPCQPAGGSAPRLSKSAFARIACLRGRKRFKIYVASQEPAPQGAAS